MTIIQKKPRILNINPLSVVKFFYERLGEKALEQGFIHPVLYLTEREIQKKEKNLFVSRRIWGLRSCSGTSKCFWLLRKIKKFIVISPYSRHYWRVGYLSLRKHLPALPKKIWKQWF